MMTLRFAKVPVEWATIRGAASQVAIALCRHADAEGHAWPSIATLMSETELGRAAVFRALRTLQKDGKITKADVQDRAAVTYELDLPWLAPRSTTIDLQSASVDSQSTIVDSAQSTAVDSSVCADRLDSLWDETPILTDHELDQEQTIVSSRPRSNEQREARAQFEFDDLEDAVAAFIARFLKNRTNWTQAGNPAVGVRDALRVTMVRCGRGALRKALDDVRDGNVHSLGFVVNQAERYAQGEVDEE
jgi:hypothetical protein